MVRGLYLDKNFINWNKISDYYEEVNFDNSNSVEENIGEKIWDFILDENVDENFSLAHC